MRMPANRSRRPRGAGRGRARDRGCTCPDCVGWRPGRAAGGRVHRRRMGGPRRHAGRARAGPGRGGARGPGAYPYLIEFRLSGEPRRMAKDLISDVYQSLRSGVGARRHPVPHMTVYGPFSIRSVRDVSDAVRRAAGGADGFDYEVDGVGTFKRGWLFMAEKEVVYLSVSDITGEIARFHDELYRLLDGRATLKEPNLGKPGKFTPHITMALREAGLDEVESYLKKHDVHAQGRICRVTLLERGRIVFEYDMERRRVMGREEALRRRNVCSGMP